MADQLHRPDGQRHRQHEARQPQALQREIGDIGAGHAEEILHRPVGREIEGGIAPARRQQRHQIGARQDEEDNAEHLLEAPAQEDPGPRRHEGGGGLVGHCAAATSSWEPGASTLTSRVRPSSTTSGSCTSATRM